MEYDSNIITDEIIKDKQQLNFENKDDFDFIVINLNNLDHLKWTDTNYLDNIVNLDIYNIVNTNPNNFLNDIVNYLNINKYNEKSDAMIETQVIAEFPEFIYEMLYINNIDKTLNDDKNDLASLLITNGETVYGNVVVFKTYLPKQHENIVFVNINKEDIKLILEKRIKTSVVIYDGVWSEIDVIGNLENYANQFFDDGFLKFEIPFLKHNINIWYEKLDGCNSNICGKILQKPIYKCLWFTMVSDEYRGSLSLDEVKKIIELSYKLNYPYEPYEEWISEEKDTYGRNKIKNKYRILEKAYCHLISKNI